MSFPKQMAAATLVVVAGVSGLFVLGQRKQAERESSAEGAAPSEAPETAPADTRPVGAALQHETRALVPPSAWLVADFRGDLTGNMPFVEPGEEGLCAKVQAPSRVSLAILPPVDESGPILQLAAPDISEAFWGCARDRIVRAGGVPIAQNDQFDVLKSPSGIVARGPDRSILFLSNERHLEAGLAVLAGLNVTSASAGPHAELYRRMHPQGAPKAPTALDMTLSLPPDWLKSVGKDAETSPLRYLKGAHLTLAQDGSAEGGIDCEEAGCDEVLAFLERAKADLSQVLPEAARQTVNSSLSAHHEKGTGRVSVKWSKAGGRLQDLLAPFFGGGPAL